MIFNSNYKCDVNKYERLDKGKYFPKWLCSLICSLSYSVIWMKETMKKSVWTVSLKNNFLNYAVKNVKDVKLKQNHCFQVMLFGVIC